VALAKLMYYASRSLDPEWILEKRTISRFLGSARNGVLLDLGCREGFKSEFFAKRGFRVIGIDINEPSVERAKTVFSGPGRDFVIASGNRIPFKTASFARVACLNSITVFDAPGEALKEVRRILKDDGELLVTATSVSAPWSNMRKYTKAALEGALEQAGFMVVGGCSYVRSPILQWLERLKLGLKSGSYRLVKMPLFLLSWPFAMLERPGGEDGYIIGAWARKRA
jgi:ubiquinone/menaquinone biosynthesis C-methylase UbiE